MVTESALVALHVLSSCLFMVLMSASRSWHQVFLVGSILGLVWWCCMQAFAGCVLSPAPLLVPLISSSAAADWLADAVRPLNAERLAQVAVDEDLHFLAGGNCSSPQCL